MTLGFLEQGGRTMPCPNRQTRTGIAAIMLIVVACAGVASAQQQTPLEQQKAKLRRAYEAASIYKINAPIQIEERMIMVDLTDSDAHEIRWDLESESFQHGSTAGNALGSCAIHISDHQAFIDYLEEQGEVRVLHKRRWMALNEGPGTTSYVHSGQALPYSAEGAPAEKASRVTEHRQVGTRVTVKFNGIVRGETLDVPVEKPYLADFDVTVNATYLQQDSHKEPPVFCLFDVETRARVRDGDTLIFEDLNDRKAMLFLLTIDIVDDI